MKDWVRCLLILSPPFVAWIATYASYEPGLPSFVRDNLVIAALAISYLAATATLATAPLRLKYKIALGVLFSVLAPPLMLLGVIFAGCTKGACL